MPLAAQEAEAQFQTALAEKNFRRRCNLLSALGRDIKEADSLGALLDGLGGAAAAGGAQAFTDHARLLVAKAACCLGYGKKFLDSPSQAVRFEAVRGKGLLKPEDAKATFLSPDSSLKLKKFLVRCPTLASDSEVVEHAWQLFSEKDLEVFWEVMLRIEDQDLFEDWLGSKSNNKVREKLEEKQEDHEGLPLLARKFPDLVIKLVREEVISWRWYWAKDLLNSHPEQVLRVICIGGHHDGLGPKLGYKPGARHQDFLALAESWGWRRQPQVMLNLIKELGAKVDDRQDQEKIKTMVSHLSEVTSNRHYITNNQRIDLMLQAWSLLPDALKDKLPAGMAHHFVNLLPQGSEHRQAELDKILAAMWKMVGEVGRTNRRELLVGSQEKPVQATSFLKMFAKKVPVPQAVDKFFFRILQDSEAGREAYLFMQSDVCTSQDGRFDELMLKVFDRYVKKVDDEGKSEDAESCVRMFNTLLKDAKSQDVIQHAVALLVAKLDDTMGLELLRSIVRRMGTLDLEVKRELEAKVPPQMPIPIATLPVPVDWVCFISPPATVAPHIDFLITVLHSGTGEKELLGAMLSKYGRCFFWDTLDTVLSWLSGRKGTELLKPLPSIKTDVFSGVEVVAVADIKLEEHTQKKLAKSTSKNLVEADKAWTEYFTNLSDAKKKVNAKDPSNRNEGYALMIGHAVKYKDSKKPWEDLLGYYTTRFNAEQEPCRTQILSLVVSQMPFEFWEEFLQHFKNLWKLSSKARESASYASTWKSAGTRILNHCLSIWRAGEGASDFCLFGLEVAPVQSELPSMLVTLATTKGPDKTNTLSKDAEALKSAALWTLQMAVPLESEAGIPLATFWSTVQTFGKLEKDCGSERVLWKRWPFLHEWWASLLKQGSTQKSAEFIFVTIVQKLIQAQVGTYCQAPRGFIQPKGKDQSNVQHEHSHPWWEPLACHEYKAAVAGVLSLIESGEIPAKEGSSIIVRRMEVLEQVAIFTPIKVKRRAAAAKQGWAIFPRRRVRTDVAEFLPSRCGKPEQTKYTHKAWVSDQCWDLPKHRRFGHMQWSSYRVHDSIALPEIQTLHKVLAGGQARRQVLWRIAEIAATVAGPEISKLIENAIATLDPKFEGMARCISRHYPYLNCALTRDEDQKSSSDVLTPLVELWLWADETRDQHVAKLMERKDCEYFLFFGQSFSRHLSNARQEWLHKCLQKLRTDEAPQFFHYMLRGPKLLDLAMLPSGSAGWRKALTCDIDRELPASTKLQVYLWHPDTQAEFLQKALLTTDLPTLSLIPRLVWADSFAKVSSILDLYPKEQTAKDIGGDVWGWEVIQAMGAYSDIATEVARRFQELPKPPRVDAVEDQQIEVLLTSLGRSDDAARSLKVLGNYAGKVKQAKEAVTKMITQVSPPQARELIRDVMLTKKAGVGMQVAGLKKIAELHIPNALELYKKAYNNGHCQRDICGNILAQVALSGEVTPEDARGFFDFFDLPNKEDVQSYVADFLLDELMKCPDEWAMPFLPSVISKLAVLPSITGKAMQALRKDTSHPTEVLDAITSIYRTAQLASRSEHTAKGGQDAQLFKDLVNEISPCNLRKLLNDLLRFQGSTRDLDTSDPKSLQAFVVEVMKIWEELHLTASSDRENVLTAILSVWAKLLRRGRSDEWHGILNAMYSRFGELGAPPYTLKCLAQALCDRYNRMSPDQNLEERNAMLATIGDFLRDCFASGHVTTADSSAEVAKGAADDAFLKAEKDKFDVGKTIVFNSWSNLLANGCPEAESASLFAHCPPKHERQLAESFVNAAVAKPVGKTSGKQARQQRRPDEGWVHECGIVVTDLDTGIVVRGVVTNSSKQFGVFLDFGCVRDGKLNVPESEYLKYRVGDVVEDCIINTVQVSSKTKQGFITLLPPSAGGKKADGASARTTARRAIKWLAESKEARPERWATLCKLFASLLALESDGSFFHQDLALLGGDVVDAGQRAQLVERVLDEEPARPLAHAALLWLAERRPVDAVRLWPALLKHGPSQENEVQVMPMVEGLLQLCTTHKLDFPKLKGVVARGLPDDVLKVLQGSPLPEARLAAVQALQQQQHEHGKPPALLQELKADACHIVRAAAQMLWKALGGAEDKAEEEEEGDE